MKKFWLLSLLLVVGLTTAALLPPSTSGQKVKFKRSENGVPNRYIVVLNPKFVDPSAAAVESEAAYLGAVHGGKVKKIYSSALQGFVSEMNEAAAFALSKNERVAFVEQDGYTSVEATQAGATWGLDRIDQRALPMDSNYSYNTDASNVHAYIIDSGVRASHVEFGGRVSLDYDAVGDGQNGNDCLGHGTHVAGTVGAATWGVAKNVRIHSVRVLPCTSSGMISDLLEGIDWVKANHIKPAVANISITASGPSSSIDTAIQSAVSAGVTMVVAAGNSNLDACNYSPARASSAITVGATYTADEKAGYSNWGPCVDIWAPGSGITSVSNANDFDSRGMSGTSMASPHVAGVAALYLASNPYATPAAVVQNITGTATAGAVKFLDATSPNRLLYSLMGASGSTPTPTPTPVITPTPTPTASPTPTQAPGRVTIKKRTNSVTESTSTTAFPYNAINLTTSNFTLQPNNQFEDVNVTHYGSANTITVTEAQVNGWALSSITCVEMSGETPNVVNSTVDLANRKANIVVEPGEYVECTFTSDEVTPVSYSDVSGRVVNANGAGVKAVQLRLVDIASGQSYSASTNSFGYYSFSKMLVGRQYTLTAMTSRKNPIADNVRTFTLSQDPNIYFLVSR
jgi:subtilisin family serine protease